MSCAIPPCKRRISVPPMLDVAGIRVGYGVATALWDVTLTVGDGELVCVVGPNGAGKTTLIDAIAGLNPIRAGRLSIAGRDVSRLPAHRYCAAGVAIVPESRRLFATMTVRENLELGSYVARAKRHRARSLAEVCALFPAIAEKLDRPAGSLSGGQQQMVAIGRALMARPRLLLLVEQNVTMAMGLAHRAYVLDEGRVVAEGTPASLASHPEIARAYLGA